METWQVCVVIAVVSILPLLWGLFAQRSYMARLEERNLELADQILKAEKQCEDSDLELAEMVEQRDRAIEEARKHGSLCRDVAMQRDRYEREAINLKQQFEEMKHLRNDWERKFDEVKALAEEEHAKVNSLKLQIDGAIGREDKLAHALRQMREKYNEAHAQLCQADDQKRLLEGTIVSLKNDYDNDRQQWAKALDAQQKRVEELERNVSLADARGYDEGRQAMFELFQSHLNLIKQDVLGVIGSHDDLTTVGCG